MNKKPCQKTKSSSCDNALNDTDSTPIPPFVIKDRSIVFDTGAEASKENMLARGKKALELMRVKMATNEFTFGNRISYSGLVNPYDVLCSYYKSAFVASVFLDQTADVGIKKAINNFFTQIDLPDDLYSLVNVDVKYIRRGTKSKKIVNDLNVKNNRTSGFWYESFKTNDYLRSDEALLKIAEQSYIDLEQIKEICSECGEANAWKYFAVAARFQELINNGCPNIEILKGKTTDYRNYLNSPLQHYLVTAESIPWILRFADAVGFDHSKIKALTDAGKEVFIHEHPNVKAKDSTIDQTMRVFNQKNKGTDNQKLSSIRKLVDNNTISWFEKIIQKVLKLHEDGLLSPLKIPFGAPEIVKPILERWPSPVKSMILISLICQLSDEDISILNDYLMRGKNITEALKMFLSMNVEEQWSVLSEISCNRESSVFNLRAHAFACSVDEVGFEEVLDSANADDGATVVDGAAALLDRAVLAGAKSKTGNSIVKFLKAQLDSGRLTPEAFRTVMTTERMAVFEPGFEKALDTALKKVIDATQAGDRRAATEELLTFIEKDGAKLMSPPTLAGQCLDKLYHADLTRVRPLDEVDKELGGVVGKAFAPEEESKPKGKTVSIAGIDLPVNDRTDKDTKAIPRKAHADLIVTPTTRANLEMLAVAWDTQRPCLLEGPTSSGKTSAVRYMAYKTGSPYRRINLSYYTDVSDLLGRYVGGELRFSKEDLTKKSDSELHALAKEYGIESTESGDIIKQVLAAQVKARWVDGPVVKAMQRGEALLLDEINLARPEVLERLNSLFDADGNLVLCEHRNEVIAPDKNFRIFATMNPASYSGRERLSKAMRSRWNNVYAHGLTKVDIAEILRTLYGKKIPTGELAKLVGLHDALSRMADEGVVGRSAGGLAYSLRNAFRVCDRFLHYQGGGLSDEALMHRESYEVYAGGLFDEQDQKHVADIFTTAMPYDGPDFYKNLEIKETADSWQLGDVVLPKLHTGHDLVPNASAGLVLTERTKQILYRMAKALEMGENVALIGERACGKTAMAKMMAMVLEQPYYRQLMSGSSDGTQLVGGFDNMGWKDGLLLDAGRPDGVAGLFVADELNLASPALLERLNSVLDDERKLVLSEKEGEEILLHKDFKFVAAMNPPQKGYGGRQKLSKAMQNRLTMIYVPDANTKPELSSISTEVGNKIGVEPAVTEALVNLHVWLQESYENETIGKELRDLDQPEVSLRQLLRSLKTVSNLSKKVGLSLAYLYAVRSQYVVLSDQRDNNIIINKAKRLAK